MNSLNAIHSLENFLFCEFSSMFFKSWEIKMVREERMTGQETRV